MTTKNWKIPPTFAYNKFRLQQPKLSNGKSDVAMGLL